MNISTAYGQMLHSLTGQPFEAETPLAPSAQPAQTAQALPSKDQVLVSDQALDSFQKLGQNSDQKPATVLELLKDVLGLLTGKDVTDVQTPAADESAANSQPALGVGYQETTLSTESMSLSLTGTIATKDGKQLGYSLSLQYDHASYASQSAQLQTGGDGLSLNFAGTSAELTSTSFSFTLSATGDDTPTRGRGSFHLNDQMSQADKQMKPLMKAFLEATGRNGDWGHAHHGHHGHHAVA